MAESFGIFVGGRGRRMAGAAKGLLRSPLDGQPLVVRMVRIAFERGLRPTLVGHHEYDAELEAAFGSEVFGSGAFEGQGTSAIACLPDEPAGVGPLGGLCALLRHATGKYAYAVAVDMPFVDSDAIGLLQDAPHTQPIVTARVRHGAPLEPFFARYEVAAVRPELEAYLERGERSLQGLLRQFEPCVLPVTQQLLTALEDWDTPADVARGQARVHPRPTK